MFERFTERARQVVVLAQDEARLLQHDYLGTEHLLLGLLREETGVAGRALERLGIAIDEVRSQVERTVGRGESRAVGQIPFTPRAKKVLELALREAIRLEHNYLGTEHILLGLVRENDGVAARVLDGFGADAATVRGAVEQLLSGTRRPPTPQSTPTPAQVPQVLGALEAAIARLLGQQRVEAAGALRSKERQIKKLLREIAEDLRELEDEGGQAEASTGERSQLEYGVATLGGSTETWPAQLSDLRREGWELLAVVNEDGVHRALLERRV